jgi:GxxExxY protein
MTENAVAKDIVDVAYRIHTVLGPGLFESVYEAVLASELEKRGLQLARQQPIPVVYEGTRFELGFRADLVVEDKVIVEIKSIADLAALHKKQLRQRLGISACSRSSTSMSRLTGQPAGAKYVSYRGKLCLACRWAGQRNGS